MTQKATSSFPKTASILALVGGILITLGGMFFVVVSTVILPNLDLTQLHTNLPQSMKPSIIPGVVGAMGAFGLISGIIVMASAVLLRVNTGQREVWGILILVFSVLSFLGPGGFFVGAILGILGGIMTLMWKPSTQ